jgi:hypothetical protein
MPIRHIADEHMVARQRYGEGEPEAPALACAQTQRG